MPKQSLKDPVFRCNTCKEYFSAPEHSVLYQCPVHGYICENHFAKYKSWKGHRKNSTITLDGKEYFKNLIARSELCEKKAIKYSWDNEIKIWVEIGLVDYLK